GYNYRMDGIQGAILRVKLRRLADWTAARRQHAVRYNELLAGMPLRRPAAMAYGSHVYHLYVIRTGERAALQESLAAQGIQTGIHYPFPVHLLRAHADLGYHRGDFPVAETAANEVLSLPMYAELTDNQIAEICGAIQAFANTTRTQAAAVA
ncbi:MAG: DegT/DnrJ/EryC1/StrS family aminotransferase, partial [Acidobacteriia bacterium]|nr:DegT/DnrJ/EryC1/StrS family aminotransferase [Terriglobia bacterium]